MNVTEKLTLGRGPHIASAAMLLYGVVGATALSGYAASPFAVAILIGASAAIWILSTRVALIARLGFPAYLIVQTGLVTACMVVAHGIVTLHYMPLVSQAAAVWRRRYVIALSVGFLACHVGFGAYFSGWRTATIEITGFTAACAFVIAVTEIATAERRARFALAAAHTRLAEYAASVEELATLRERNRLAREVHDSVGHYLTVINVQLEAAERLLAIDPQRAADAIAKARAHNHEVLDDIRRSVAALRASPAQDRPLPDAITALAADLTAAGTPAALAVRGEVRALDPAVALALFRTAQEALTNIRKHAAASNATVELDYRPTAVALTIHDDGRGASDHDRGFGLLGIRERIALVGGALDVVTAPGAGFRLRVEVPG